MESVSRTAHLGVLACLLLATLLVPPILLSRYSRLGSFMELCRQPQTGIMIMKSILDSALVTIAAIISKETVLDNGIRLWLATDVLIRFSITCVISLEFLYLWNVFEKASVMGLGRLWRRAGPVVTLTLTLLKFLPFISWQDEALHFYTIFSATFVDFLLFTLVHWQTLNFIQRRRKWQSSLVECIARCFMIAILALMFLVIGWRVSEIRRLLLDIFLFLITMQLPLQNGRIESRLAARNRNSKPGLIRTHDAVTSTRGPSTVTPRNPSADDDVMVLYAKSFSELQVAKEGSLFSLPSMSGFPSDVHVAAHLASPRPEMTDFVQDHAFNGENFISVWPERFDHVKNGYLESWRCKETQRDKKQHSDGKQQGQCKAADG